MAHIELHEILPYPIQRETVLRLVMRHLATFAIGSEASQRAAATDERIENSNSTLGIYVDVRRYFNLFFFLSFRQPPFRQISQPPNDLLPDLALLKESKSMNVTGSADIMEIAGAVAEPLFRTNVSQPKTKAEVVFR
ncbi:hypothetical protein G7Y89_g4990 [Cudoniella acicularis]|uniref:Uncharacterized protein n=1 Tax=Cudoniella acicularis TaxID=354080 RepID=A0A8H4W652_9HELO|nr:hypothetical protein G7Y89_g4990 [Cudoniella acicularis]